ncbi:MAG: hypothetical protein Q7U76_12515 [Nitrospirota bacterium]|nr:hypothetical protein [Nitrospirota bacterium]
MIEVAQRGCYVPPASHTQGLWHETTFTLPGRQAAQDALTLTELLLRHPCAEAYGNDQRVNLHRMVGILACYAHSFGVIDYRAHCWVPLPRFLDDRTPITYVVTSGDAPAQEVAATPAWLFPCQYASPASNGLSLTHQASLRAQVESALVQYECAWCPRLRDLDHWEAGYGYVTKPPDE